LDDLGKQAGTPAQGLLGDRAVQAPRRPAVGVKAQPLDSGFWSLGKH
jgi:hypothetical protein